MAVATHLGPWLLGTIKTTMASLTQTNANLGGIRNIGATTVTQSKTIAYGDTTAQTAAFVVPAGSLLLNCYYIITTAYTTTAPTLTIFSGGTQISSAITVNTAGSGLVGSQDIPLGGNSAAGAALVANVGTTDALIAFTHANGGGTTGAGTLVLEYVVRNSDGTYGDNP
jgi:hypothetical protein